MAKNVRKAGRVILHEEFPPDHPIYSEGWTIGPVSVCGRKKVEEKIEEVPKEKGEEE